MITEMFPVDRCPPRTQVLVGHGDGGSGISIVEGGRKRAIGKWTLARLREDGYELPATPLSDVRSFRTVTQVSF